MELIVNFIKMQPLFSIIVFSFLITLLLTIIYKKFSNQEKHEEVRQKQKEFREKAKLLKNEPEKLMQLQKEMMEASMGQMKDSFKPLFISLLPLIFIFTFIKQVYTEAGVGDIISWHVNLPLIGTGAGWFLSYMIFSLVFSSILRKILKVY